MSSLTERALRIALDAHQGQTRKIDKSPYIVHPIMVAMRLTRHGFSEEVVAAGLVHDVVEDTPLTREDLARDLGESVAALVDAVSEDKTIPWEDRKRKYIEVVRSGSEGVKAISVCDKIHNAESLILGHSQIGAGIWQNFTRGREQQLWFQKEMLRMLQESWRHPLVEEFAAVVARLEQLL